MLNIDATRANRCRWFLSGSPTILNREMRARAGEPCGKRESLPSPHTGAELGNLHQTGRTLIGKVTECKFGPCEMKSTESRSKRHF